MGWWEEHKSRLHPTRGKHEFQQECIYTFCASAVKQITVGFWYFCSYAQEDLVAF